MKPISFELKRGSALPGPLQKHDFAISQVFVPIWRNIWDGHHQSLLLVESEWLDYAAFLTVEEGLVACLSPAGSSHGLCLSFIWSPQNAKRNHGENKEFSFCMGLVKPLILLIFALGWSSPALAKTKSQAEFSHTVTPRQRRGPLFFADDKWEATFDFWPPKSNI